MEKRFLIFLIIFIISIFSCKKDNNLKDSGAVVNYNDINNFINSFANGDCQNIADDEIKNNLMKLYADKELEFEGMTYGANPMQIGITIKDNKKDLIQVTAYCLFKNQQTLKDNENLKIKGILENISMGGDPSGNRILNINLKDCEVIK